MFNANGSPDVRRQPGLLTRTDIGCMSLLASLPLMLAFFNDNWAVTSSQSGFIDPWLYTSFFLHLKAQLLAFPGAYYGDRLSVTLTGWLIYQSFGPWIGNFVYKLLVICTASFSLYFTALRLFNRRTALLGGLLVVAQPFFLMAFGWDYVDGIGVAYFSLSLFFVFRASQSSSFKVSMFLAGVFCNCLITSHFLWLNLGWLVPVAFVLANRIGRRHSLLIALFSFTSGFVIAFIAFCAIYYGLTGKWFYLANSLGHTLNGFGAAQKVNNPIAAWINGALWLVHFNALAALVAWSLLRARADARERVCFLLFFLGYLTVWIWQLVGFPFVMLWFYMSFLFPLYALGLAALLNRPLQATEKRLYTFSVIFGLSAIVFLYSTVSFWDSLLPTWQYRGSAIAAWIVAHEMWLFSALCLAISIPICVVRPKRGWLLIGFFLGMFFVYALQLTFLPKHGWFTNRSFTNKQAVSLILKADDWTNRRVPDRRLLWWGNTQQSKAGIMHGLASLYFWGFTMLGQDMPQLSPEEAKRISAETPILAISWDPLTIDMARKALERQGLTVQEEPTTITERDLKLHLSIFKVKPDANRPAWIQTQALQEDNVAWRLQYIVPAGDWVSFSRTPSIRVAGDVPPWAYVALAPVKFLGERDSYWVRFRLKVAKGRAYLGVLNAPETDFDERKVIDQSDDFQNVILPIAHPQESHKLVIQNGERAGQLEVIVEDIALYTPGSPAAQNPIEKR